MEEQAPKKKTSPWVFVGIGCLAVIVIIVAVVGIGGFMAVRAAKSFAKDMTDPTARAAKVERMLGAHQMPDGYRPALAISLGPVMDMALLSDREPEKDGSIKGFDKHGFLYMRLPKTDDAQNLRDYMDGKREDPGQQANMNIRSEETIKRGSLTVNGNALHYVAQRGEFNNEQVKHKGITTMMLLDCPGDGRTRMAFWFGPDPDPSKSVKSLDLSGSPADESAIQDFMGHFHPCQD